MDAKIIGQRINTALADRQMKQKELAAKIGVTDNTISYFCSGGRTPNTQQIIKIANVLGVTADFLLGLENDPRRVPTAMNTLHLSMIAVDAIRDHSASGFEDVLSAFDRLIEKPEFWAMLSDVIRAKEIRGLPPIKNADTETAALKAQDVFRKAAVSNTPCKMLHGNEYADFLQFEIDKAFRNLLAEEMAYKGKTASGSGASKAVKG